MAARHKRQELRERLIEAAWELFASSGYDGTTIEKLIERVRVSKGAFYHYFTSKADVLDAVVGQMIGRGIEELARVAERESQPAIENLNEFLGASRKWRLENFGAVSAVAEVLMRDENSIIRHKVYRRIVTLMQPLLARIIRQGVGEGTFDVQDPEGTALLLLHMMNTVAEIQTRELLEPGVAPEALAVLHRRANLFIGFVERILVAPEASLGHLDLKVFETAAAKIVGAKERGERDVTSDGE